MSDTVTIEVDGESVEAPKGAMIIEVTDRLGVHVPRFCYHRKLSIAANCRMCLVEVEKAPKPMPACATPVMEGMKISTGSRLASRAQKAMMEFLLINHPLDCPICDQGGECELQDVAMGYGESVSRFTERKRVVEDKNLGPLIATDMTRCIHCTRCVRFGEEVAGMPELGTTGRGEDMRIGTFIEQAMDSEMSGNVIDVCPVGALTSKPFRFRARAWEMQSYDSVAPHDAVGSNVHVHVARGQVMRVVPRENEQINEVWLSDRDRFSYEGLYSDDRLLAPQIKRDGEWHEVDWETALAAAADGLRAMASEHGPQRLGALVSPNATVEEAYLAQRVMRGIGCANVDHRHREADFSDQHEAPSFPQLGFSISELESRDAVLLIGANPRKEHPIVNHRLRKASLAGSRVMLLNPADYELNFRLDDVLAVSPAQMVDVLSRVLCAAGGKDRLPPSLASLADGTAPSAAEAAVAQALEAADRPAVLLGPSVDAHPEGSLLRALARALADQCGASLGQLSGGANGAGAWLAGAVPHRQAGGGEAPSVGLNAREMLDAGLAGYLLLGLEPELDCDDGAAASRAMRDAQFVVSLGAYRSGAVAEYADVLLPVAPYAETSGTYVNLEGRWQSYSAAVSPPALARPAWRVLRVLGNLLDLPDFEYMTSEQVRDEVRQLVDAATGQLASWSGGRERMRWQQGALCRLGSVPIYATDSVVRRAMALQNTVEARFSGLTIGPEEAQRLGLESGDAARVRQNGSTITASVVVDARVPEGCAALAAGIEQTAGLGPSIGPISIEPHPGPA